MFDLASSWLLFFPSKSQLEAIRDYRVWQTSVMNQKKLILSRFLSIITQASYEMVGSRRGA